MLFDLTFPCYLTTFSGEKCLSGKVICAFFFPAYRSSPVQDSVHLVCLNLHRDHHHSEQVLKYTILLVLL
jgi:hypothetical protein